MIHILLAILKIIGIVLLAVIGLLIFLLLLILFVPVRYSVEGYIDNNIKIKGSIKWLLSILRLDFKYEDGDFESFIRIFGFKWKKKEPLTEDELEEDVANDVEDAASNVVKALPDSGDVNIHEQPGANQISGEHSISEEEQTANKSTSEARKKTVKPSLYSRFKAKIKGFVDNILELFKKIKSACSKGTEFLKTASEMIQSESNQHVVKKAFGEVLYLLKHFGFRKLRTDLTFSLGEPALTGQILGILCMIPLLYQYDFHIYPDFEAEQLYIKGSFAIKGRIQIIYLVITLVRLWKDKETRTFIKKILNR